MCANSSVAFKFFVYETDQKLGPELPNALTVDNRTVACYLCVYDVSLLVWITLHGFSDKVTLLTGVSITRLGCFQPHGLFSGFMGLVKFWMGWGLVGLDGCFSDFYRKISEILGCFVGKLGWFWDLEF